MGSAYYDARCLLCGSDAGQVQAASLPGPVQRCGRCGGAVYLEPVDLIGQRAADGQADLAAIVPRKPYRARRAAG
jgi:hypothetical protein